MKISENHERGAHRMRVLTLKDDEALCKQTRTQINSNKLFLKGNDEKINVEGLYASATCCGARRGRTVTKKTFCVRFELTKGGKKKAKVI